MIKIVWNEFTVWQIQVNGQLPPERLLPVEIAGSPSLTLINCDGLFHRDLSPIPIDSFLTFSGCILFKSSVPG